MHLRIKYLYLRVSLFVQRINRKLPRLLRITKFGLITTFVSLILASTSVYAAKDRCANTLGYLGNRNCSNASSSSMVPGLVTSIESWVNPVKFEEELTPAGETISYYEGGMVSKMNAMVIKLYYEQSQHLSGVEHIADTIESAGLVQPVQASPTGYVMFSPIQDLWRISRNIALAFIIVIGLGLALMIMLRVQQGQGYVTIMNALPKLVVTVILILFSYTIAGLLVDLGNVAERTLVDLYYTEETIVREIYQGAAVPTWYPNRLIENRADPTGPLKSADPKERDMHLFRLMSRFVTFDHWRENERLSISNILGTPTGISIFDNILKPLEGIAGGEGERVTDAVVRLVLGITILTGVFKIFFTLLRAFGEMIIYTIFSPIAFLAYPLSPSALMSWVRGFLANSLLFPGTFFMIFLASMFYGFGNNAPFYTVDQNIAEFAPDLLTFTTGGPGNVDFLSKMVALTIVLMIPALRPFIMQQLKVSENIMIQQAQQSVRNVGSKIPVIGGFFNM